ncbi:MAG: hypothetical protein EOO41_00635 [Methanobacteriota archaeon]|nr:MAG: hypothetical protein EOO41_00635 [Euryarchaeota archaeon]
MVHVLDAFNNTVVLDSSTTCQLRVEAPTAGVGAPPMWQLRGRTDFVAVRGVVTVSGVTVTAASVGGGSSSSGGSSSGNESDGYIALHLRCLLSSLGMNADLSRTAQVLSVRAAWTLPPPDLILASSTQLREGVAASRLGVFVSDGTPLPLVDAVCSVSVRLLRVASSDPSAPLAAEVRLLSAPMMGYRWYNTTTDGTFMSEASRDVLSSALAWGVADTASSTVTVLAAPTWAANLPPILRTTWNSTLQSLPAPTLHEIILDSIFVDAPFGAEMRLCAQCTLPDVDAPPSLCWKLRTHDVAARVHGRPPARIAPSDVFNMSLHVHDGFSGAVMDMDNATACAVTVRWTSTSAATNASVDELTRVIGGSATAINGQLHFPTLQLSSRSNEHVKLKVTCTRGGVTVPLLAADTTHAMYVTACPAGFVTPPGGYGCTQCPDGTYTDGVGETECIACPPLLATCVGGRIAFSAAPVFISPASITYTNASMGSIRLDASLDVYECWNTEACDFDTSSRSFSCAHGYSGPLCGVCDASVGYVQQGAACIACPSEAVSMLVLVLLVAAILGLLVYVTVFKRADPTNQTAVLFRITVTYFQMLGSLGIFKARGTSTFRQLLGVADTVSTSLFASAPVACLLRPSFYAQFSAMMALPLIAVLLGVLIKAVFTMLQTRSCAKLWQYVVRREFMAPAVVVLYTTYPLLVTQTLRALNCRAQPVAGVRYLVVDLSVPCGTSAHTIVVAVAAVILALFGAGIPALIVCLLRRRRLRLHEEESVAQFGFLYSGYDVARGMYWWEALVLARKAGVVLLASLISDAYISTFAAIIVTFLALCAHALFRPYRSQLFNLLEGGSLATLCVTQMVCILYLRTEQLAADGTSGVSALAADAAISAVLLTMNAGMALLLLGVGARLLTQRHAAAIERVAKRVPCCARLLHSRLLCACCKAVLPPEETRAALHDATAAAAQHLKLAPPHVMSLAEYRQPPRSRMATTLAGSSDGPNIVHTPGMSLAAAGWSVRNPLAAGGAANAHATTASPELNDVATRAAAKVSRTAFPPATRV